MPYVAFEECAIFTGDHTHRGVRVVCGHCGNKQQILANTYRTSGDGIDEVEEKQITRKLEKLGWMIGKNPSKNRCPACFGAIKGSAIRKKKEKEEGKVVDHKNKVVPINGTAVTEHPREMTRDEGRIIFEELNGKYDKSSYLAGWSDTKVAEDLGVCRAWVTQIREKFFGPDVNEESVKLAAEAQTLLAEIKAVGVTAEPIVRTLNDLVRRAEHIEKALQKLTL